MTIKEFIESRHFSISEFARIVGNAWPKKPVKISTTAMSTYCHKKRTPPLPIAMRIKDASYGRITFNDMLRDEEI